VRKAVESLPESAEISTILGQAGRAFMLTSGFDGLDYNPSLVTAIP
jgi:hypothetical protein